ncbi:MAG TPA: hypothetical protein VM554_03135 [Acidisarcina sp.]|nr:hypothetical protein [Acidisarcina sp.]
MDLHELLPVFLFVLLIVVAGKSGQWIAPRPKAVRWILQPLRWAILVCSTLSVALYGYIVIASHRFPAIVSPDHRYAASVEEFHGGPANPFHTSVMVHAILGVDHLVAFTSRSDPRDIKLEWISDRKLMVFYPEGPQAGLGNDPEWSCTSSNKIEVSCNSYKPQK